MIVRSPISTQSILFMQNYAPLDADAGRSLPSLYCIGRSERRKGNDLFVELAAWLRRSSFYEAAHIGEQDSQHNRTASGQFLGTIAKRRGLDIPHRSAMNRKQLLELFSRRSIVVLPVRYDTFNLIALEALFSGCPVVISNRAGVCDYLDSTHPGLPYTKIDFENFYSAVPAIQALVDDCDAHRKRLTDYLLSQQSHVDYQPLQMQSIYSEFLNGSDDGPRVRRDELLHYVEQHPIRARFTDYRKRLLTDRIPNIRIPIRIPNIRFPIPAIHSPMRTPGAFLRDKALDYFGDDKYFATLQDAKCVPARLASGSHIADVNQTQLRDKLDAIYEISSNPLYRCNFWRDIARIERILGNELIAVTYESRILRLLGEDKLNLLPQVLATSKKHGFVEEAKVAGAMYADPADAENRIHAYLQDAYERNRVRQDKPWLYVEDHRTPDTPRVSVIVSLYNAADKLGFFLTALLRQTLVRKGEVEIILADSGSPADEKAIYDEFRRQHSINAIYARSEKRETIQSAWNRGIGLARAPFLVFLGVDETLYPEGLEVLAAELDQNPDVDWVMANSLVTAVEENGALKNDIMSYDRTGGSKEHTYLETCYLSWVGGMYRKNIHDRFGYYDETFGAAGDTEIKNRILPYIKVKFVPRTLGLFLNYPDGQTTASPRAEIEDLRAWYIHRTLGGVRYAFQNRPADDVRLMLATSLGYRKSYCGHVSSDIEYASALANYLSDRMGMDDDIAEDLETLQTHLRAMEFTHRPVRRIDAFLSMVRTWRTFKNLEAKHRARFVGQGWPLYTVFNDNRYEQHSWLWKSR
jgi:glycosyltransferase involved in cell wall biosynthesis